MSSATLVLAQQLIRLRSLTSTYRQVLERLLSPA
jgi:hypothetical protein